MTYSNSVFNDARTNLRVKDNRRIAWYLNGREIKGQAKIRNISASGMLIETNSTFKPDHACTFSFDTALGHDNYIPQHGRLIWFKKKSLIKNKYECGIKFIEPTDFVLGKLRQRIQKGIIKLTAKRRLNAAAGGLIVSGIAVMIVFIVWQAVIIYENLRITNERMLGVSSQQADLTRQETVLRQSYEHRLDAAELQILSLSRELSATKALYQESETLLSGVSVELETTKGILAETERLLAQSEAKLAEISVQNNRLTDQNASLNNKLQGLAGLDPRKVTETRNEINNTIALLQEKNLQLGNELKILQDQLKFYEGDVKNGDEARVLLSMYKERMKEVKSKVKFYREEAEAVRIAALKEQDRIKLALGNNGFIVKNGSPVNVDYEKFENAQAPEAVPVSARPAVEQRPVAGPPSRQIEIDVSFFE